MRLYAVSDFNQWRLVKQKMATIFKMDFCRALTSYNADASLFIFGGKEHVMKTLEETKKQRTLIKNSLFTTKKARKTDKSPGRIEARSLQPGEPKPKAKAQEPNRRPGLILKPRLSLSTTGTRRYLLLKGRTKMNLVSLFQIILHPVIPLFLSRASVEPV